MKKDKPTNNKGRNQKTGSLKENMKSFLPKKKTRTSANKPEKTAGSPISRLTKAVASKKPGKSDENAPLLDGNIKIPPQFCIRTKLIGCFIIPVIMIIVLGVVSYSRSSSALNESYETAVLQTMNMATDYFSFVFSNIESDMNVYLLDTDLSAYYSGEYSTNEAQKRSAEEWEQKYKKAAARLERQREGTLAYYRAYKDMADAKLEREETKRFITDTEAKEDNAYKSLNTSVSNKAAANQFIKNIYIFKNEQNIISSQPSLRATAETTENYQKIDASTTGLYDKFLETQLGQDSAGDATNYHWAGPVPELDEILSVNSDDYVLRVAHDLTSTSDAFIVVDIDRNSILNILEELNVGDGSYVGLISVDDQELTVEGKSLATDMEEEEDSDPTSSIVGETVYTGQDFYQNALASEEASGSDYVRYNGKSYLFTYEKIGTTGIMLCSLVPTSIIVGPANSILLFTIIIILIASAIALAVGILISEGFSRSINKSIEELKKVSKGDLTVEFRTNRRDEFALLYGSCNDMLANIRSLIMEVKSVYETLSVSLNKVDSSSSTFSETMKDIQVSIHEVEGGVGEQTESATECLTEMNSLFDKINNVNENANEIGNIAVTTKDAIETGLSTVDNLNEKTRLTTNITKNIIETIKQLSDHSRNIGLILSSINDIAEETNLLSLNASIEAARAGAAGKGFSVVANQIRKLADQSLTSAGEIADIVNEITTATDKAVMTAENAEGIVEEQAAAVADTAQSFQELKQRIDRLSENLEGIQGSSKDMESSGSSTLKSMESISAILEETLASITSVATGTDKQSEALTSLNDASNQLVTRAERLGDAISKFKTN